MLPAKPVVRFMIPDSELGLGAIMEKTVVEEEEEGAATEDADSVEKHKRNEKIIFAKKSRNSRKRRTRSFRKRKCFQREESIRKEVVGIVSIANLEETFRIQTR